MIESLAPLLSLLSNALLLPDLLLLLAGVALSLAFSGGLLGEAWRRRRLLPRHRALVEELAAAAGRQRSAEELRQESPLLARCLPGLGPAADRDKLLDDLRLGMDRSLERLNVLVRLGPMLGLAGTLIPLGPGLVALSEGDVVSLSRHLVVAFTTTVLGLFIGGCCYVLLSVRRRWYEQDLGDLEFLLGRIEP